MQFKNIKLAFIFLFLSALVFLSGLDVYAERQQAGINATVNYSRQGNITYFNLTNKVIEGTNQVFRVGFNNLKSNTDLNTYSRTVIYDVTNTSIATVYSSNFFVPYYQDTDMEITSEWTATPPGSYRAETTIYFYEPGYVSEINTTFTMSKTFSVVPAEAPIVGAVSATDPIDLATGSTVMVWCNATITDNNGFEDINHVNATLWDSAETNETAADDNNNHYTNSSCMLYGGSDNTVNTACSFILYYYANEGSNWICKLTANDTTGYMGSNTTTLTINELVALDLSITSMDYGLLTWGEISSEKNISVTNYGNIQIDINLSGSDAAGNTSNSFNCTTGFIPIGNEKYNISYAGQDYDTNMVSVTGYDTTITSFDLSQVITDGIESNQTIYWKLKIPLSDVSGNCTGKIRITAIKSI
jgi:hypothetical protein